MTRTFPQLAGTAIEFAWGGFVDISMNRAPDFGRLSDVGAGPGLRERLLPAGLLRPRAGAHRTGRQGRGRGHLRRREAPGHLLPHPPPRLPGRAPAAHAGARAGHGLLPVEGSAVTQNAAMSTQPAERPIVLVPADNRMLGAAPVPRRRQEVRRRGATGRLPAARRAVGRGRRGGGVAVARGRRAADGIGVERAPQPFRRGRPRPGPAARPGARRVDAAADAQGHRAGRAAARHLSRLPGNQRRPRRHAAPGRAGPAPASTTTARPATRRSTSSTAWRTTSTCCRAACSRGILGAGPVRVNSVHGQGANRLAPGARIEALAPDGLVEAFTLARGQRLQPVPAMAPRMAGSRQSGVDEAAARLRRGLPELSRSPPGARARPRPLAAGRLQAARSRPARGASATTATRTTLNRRKHRGQEQFHLQRPRTVVQRTARHRDRMPGARPHRCGARQDPAAREVHRGPRHAAAARRRSRWA